MMLILGLMLLVVASQASDIIEGEYLLGLKPEYDAEEFGHVLWRDYQMIVRKVWDIKRTKIMLVEGDEVDAQSVGLLPQVKYISNNGWMHLHQNNTCTSTAHPGVWGVDRIDQREALSYSSPSNPSAVYEHGMYNGEGVNAYVTDTGIDITHPTFGGRAVWGYTASGIDDGDQDGNGHGTHCAGTIGGLDYGVAKGCNLIAVKVVEDSGSGAVSSFVDGLAWVQQQHVEGVDRSVVSASLGYNGDQPALEEIIAQMFAEGINIAVSAGNDDGDSCQQSPARAPEAITVAATEVTDTTASFTNYGSCVDIHAPGVDVLSAAPGGGSDVKSGTSMSAPHVAGALARYLSTTTGNPPTSQEVTNYFLGQATVDAVIPSDPDHGSSPNLLLYSSCTMASPK